MSPLWYFRLRTLLLPFAVLAFLASMHLLHGEPKVASAEAALPITSTFASSTSALPKPVPDPAVLDVEQLPLLRLETLGTRESIELTPFAADGTVRPEEMATLSALFAPKNPRGLPPKAEDVTEIDPRLAELLMRISEELGDKPLVVVSGHRNPGRGTSRKSYHVRGMAADVAVVGVKSIEVRKAALRAGAGGVGLYPGFVHVDVRDEPYQWGAGRWRPRPNRPKS